MADHRLFIFMRDDMESMSPGRCCAQASHATSHFTTEMERLMADKTKAMEPFMFAFDEWQNATEQHFGTAIVLGVNEAQLKSIIGLAIKNGFICDIINDPTYGVKDGEVVHLISVDTCGYVFLPEAIVKQVKDPAPAVNSDFYYFKKQMNTLELL